MCGIAGILTLEGPPPSRERLARMTDAMVHRGPDDCGFYLGEGVGLAMRRLAIIDVAGGHQPIANETGTVQVVLNGEIYNFRELRRELEARGHRFSTTTDTEVIVHLYEDDGPAFVERLRGMFGLALWDANERRLVIARDRLGIKPLYVAERGGTLYFASELKAILALGELPLELDWGAVHHLFSFMTTPSTRSVVAGVGKLEPGHLLIAERDGTVRVRRYWEPCFEPDEGPSEGEWIEALRAALDEAVALHLRSDVPLGAFLSGGVDSSAIVGAMSAGSSDPVRTFSIGFRESEYDELQFARLASRAFGTTHHEAVLEPEVMAVLEDLAWYLDEPFGDSSAIPTFMVSKLAAREVKVVLSGDGGDELFAGYDKYRVERRERLNRFLPAPLRRFMRTLGDSLREGATGRELLRHLALVGGDRYLDAGTLFRADRMRKLFRPEHHDRVLADDGGARDQAVRCLGAPDLHWLSALQRFDLETYLPLDILTKVDRMSMAHSIEARVPLLDHVIVELAARIPPRLQLAGGEGKHLFKLALQGRVPQPILERPKRGFAVPLGSWFRGGLGGFVRDLLLGERSRDRGVFDPVYLEQLLRQHDGGRPLDLELWTLISFELWCRRFLDGASASRAASTPALRLVTAQHRNPAPVLASETRRRGSVLPAAVPAPEARDAILRGHR